MSKINDKIIYLQKQNVDDTESWTTVKKLHARVNKSSKDADFLGGGASQQARNLSFVFRWGKFCEDLDKNRHLYRVLYRGVPFIIEDYDDFQYQHKEVKVSGVSYCG